MSDSPEGARVGRASSGAEPAQEPTPPLVEATELRVAIGGGCELDAFSLCTSGNHLLLAGDAEPLLAALFGAALDTVPATPDADEECVERRVQLLSGSLRLRGMALGSGDYHAAVGLAPLDPPLPERWPLADYLEWSARLGGAGRRQARMLARATMRRLGLEAGSGRRLGTLTLAERRAAVLAQAVVASPRIIVAQSPLGRLDGPSSEWLAQVLARACEGLDWVLSVSRLRPPGAESRLLGQATDLCYVRHGRLLVHRTPNDLLAGSSWLEVCVAGPSDGLAAALASDGIELAGGPASFLALVPAAEQRAAAAATSATSRVLAAAARTKAPVVRCTPVL